MPSTTFILMLPACIFESFIHARYKILTTRTYTITGRTIAEKSSVKYPVGLRSIYSADMTSRLPHTAFSYLRKLCRYLGKPMTSRLRV
jgi:hypothetical protein